MYTCVPHRYRAHGCQNRVLDPLEQPFECWEPNWCPLLEQPVLSLAPGFLMWTQIFSQVVDLHLKQNQPSLRFSPDTASSSREAAPP